MTEATAPESLREKIARVIDPKAWETRDRHYVGLDKAVERGLPVERSRESADSYTAMSRDKADAILAFLPAPVQGEDGWPETLNELEREALKDDAEGWSITDVEIHVVLRLIAIARAAGGKHDL